MFWGSVVGPPFQRPGFCPGTEPTHGFPSGRRGVGAAGAAGPRWPRPPPPLPRPCCCPGWACCPCCPCRACAVAISANPRTTLDETKLIERILTIEPSIKLKDLWPVILAKKE